MEGLIVIGAVILIVWGLRKLYKTPSFNRALRDAADDDLFDSGGSDD